MFDLIIIGGGPAGITAGIYAVRKGLKTLILTKDFIGQAGRTSRVDNWPGEFAISGLALMKKFEEHLKEFKENIEIKTSQTAEEITQQGKNFQVKTKAEKVFLSRAVVIAAGGRPRRLLVEGEANFEGKGVSFCSICDGPFFKDKKVVVVGGGNSAFETALDLSKYAQRISILERANQCAADKLLQDLVKKVQKIEIFLNKEVQKIEGKGKVETVVFKDLKSNKTFHQPVDGVFISIGSVALSDFLKGFVELNNRGEVKVDCPTGQTSRPGVFAAGDITDSPYKQIITASSGGCRAALSAYEYLQKQN